MKRILVLLLALITVFAFTGCDDDGGIKGTKYEALHSHLYYVIESFSNYEFSVTVDGDKAEFVQVTYDDGETDSGVAYKEKQTTRLVGAVKVEDGYHVISVQKLYNSVEVIGKGAKARKEEMIAAAKEQIGLLDPETENYKEYKSRYESVIALYSGKEVDATEMSLSAFSSVTYKVKLDDEIGKITELLMFAEGQNMGGYKFEYGEDGVMTRSTETDNDGDVWEVEYRKNGTPSSFKFTDDTETLTYTCDESGKITKVE